VQVAKLAGVPAPVVARAREVLDRLETKDESPAKLDDLPLFAVSQAMSAPAKAAPSVVDAALKDLDVDGMSHPREALEALYRLKGSRCSSRQSLKSLLIVRAVTVAKKGRHFWTCHAPVDLYNHHAPSPSPHPAGICRRRHCPARPAVRRGPGLDRQRGRAALARWRSSRQALFRGRMIAKERLENGRRGHRDRAPAQSGVTDEVITALYDFTTVHVFRARNPTEGERLA
jgi:hypothetical protein